MSLPIKGPSDKCIFQVTSTYFKWQVYFSNDKYIFQVTNTYFKPKGSTSSIKTVNLKKTIASLFNPADLRPYCNVSISLDCCRCTLGIVAFWNWFYAYCQVPPYCLSFSLSSCKCLWLYMKSFLSLWWSKLDPRPIHVVFLAEKAALKQGFFPSTPVFPRVSIDQLCILIYASISNTSKSQKLKRL